jgi:PKD repeat protein
MLNDQPWVIAFWHHPPYTKGSHDSDTEGALIDMRQNALPILEAWGVDLVMTGHSHSYERSFLLDGHYGASGTLDPVANVLDPGDGRDTQGGDGAYLKPGIVAAEHAGAVYAVAGSSGKISGGLLNHPAMFLSLNSLGSLVLDVSGNRLDAVFLDQGGAVRDEFTIVKTPDEEPPLLTAATAEDATHVVVNFDEPLDSVETGNAANYAIAGLVISQAELLPGDRSVRLTTSTMLNGASYTLSVSEVQDKALNVILPGSSIDFDYFDLMARSFQDELAPDTSYMGTRDAYIREASSNTAYGLATSLQVDGDEPQGSGTDMNILLAWDIGSIPAGATVVAAEMELEVSNPSTGSYSCYALRRDWDESEVTWNQAAANGAWGAPGASAGSDRGASTLCTVTAGATGPLTVSLNAAGIAAVQAWVEDPASNHGLVISDPNTGDGADFHSREFTTKMARPRLTVTYSVAAPPNNTAPTADYTFDCIGLECSFTDTSTDSDGSVQSWSWDFGHDGQSSAVQNPVHTFPAGGTYSVTLTVTDNEGATHALLDTITVSEPPGSVDQFAEADLPSAGTVSGSYLDTRADDGTLQSITERESGGKKNQRHSYLSHTWRFTVAPGSAVTLFANAWSGGSTEGDAFLFAWSPDGNNFDDLFTVSSTSDTNMQNAAIPASGTIYIRVTDTDPTAGNNTLDMVFVDQLFIRTDNSGSPPPNQMPIASFTYRCSGLFCDFTDTSNDPDGSVDEWAWDFGGTGTSTSQNPSHSFGSPGTYTVTLTVTDDDGATGEAAVSIDVAEIGLAATGYKVRGEHTVDLSWSGAVGENVEILRDGSSLGSTPNDGVETDSTGNKGGGSYRYQICEIGGDRCSNEATVGF